MRIVRTESAFGVEISGIDPAAVTRAQGEELRRLLYQHHVLAFRNVDLTPGEHVEFMSHFGRAIVEVDDPVILSDPTREFGKVNFVTTKPDEYISGRGALGFHSDFSYTADGAGSVLSLYALEAQSDDPTIFVHMGLACSGMPSGLLQKLRQLELVKCCNYLQEPSEEHEMRYRMSHRDSAKDYGGTASLQSAVLCHPVTQEDLVNICQTFTSHVKGWSYADSDALFAEVEPWQYAEQNRHYHHWRSNDLVVWDNITLQHGRAPLKDGTVRHLQRVVSNRWSLPELQARTTAALTQASDLEAVN